MQINFYMGDQDRENFHEYIFSRGGYLTPERWIEREIPIVNSENRKEIDSIGLKIFKEDYFPKINFTNPDWISYLNQFGSYYIHGPGMEYLKSYTDDKGIHRGRIYMGLLSTSSFERPNENDPDSFIKYQGKYRQLENFYKSCCRYIRKNFRKDPAGFYHGPQSDELEGKGSPKLQI